eukprot:TRINITY_DN8642_c0_g1_i1.p1 TRINITY_DN8642_c0_g1~~TRINITY_DN8642_c0_g1_i1.p1  ORF type:complete len:420 (+),score=67.05 TRINITY_DN8642_c0_g1_i1:68-1327(+)
MSCRLGAWAILMAIGLQRSSAMCAVNTTSVDLILSRGYNLTGETHIITGGDSGIGFGIALAIAQANARIILLGHNMEKTAVAMRNITERTKNDKLSAIPIDLMSFASVKSAVAAILNSTNRVDSIICDAGLISPIQPSITADGFESAVEIQYISHFYLVELLLPELRKTKGRVVHTSTAGIDSYSVCKKTGLPEGCTTIDSLSKIVRKPNDNFSAVVDGNLFVSLWMKAMHARILAHREASNGVSAYSFSPGIVATGNVDAFLKLYGGKAAFVKLCGKSASPDEMLPGQVEACQKNPAWKHHADHCPFMPWYLCMCSGPDGVMKSCPLISDQGAVTGAYLAAAPKAELAHINGAFTVACDYIPVIYGDPYTEMVNQIGATATLEFLERFYQLSLSWIPKVGGTDFKVDGGEGQVGVLNI